jgi:large subunit ribosomal protein L24
MNIKKGDTVQILSGKDRGKTGSIIKVAPADGLITVGGLNVFKKRARPKKQGEKGETVSVPRPLPRSRVMFVCPSCKKATRLGARMDGNQKVRYCKKCQATV